MSADQPSTEAKVSAEAAGTGARAGAVIRDQVISIVEAAGSSAASSERDALARRETVLAEARVTAARVYESITTAADQLDDVRSVATREADTLRSLLARGGPVVRGAGASAVGGPEAPPLEAEEEVEATPYLDEVAASDPTPPEPLSAEPDEAEVAEWPATATDDDLAEELAADAEAVEPTAGVGHPGAEAEVGESEAMEAEAAEIEAAEIEAAEIEAAEIEAAEAEAMEAEAAQPEPEQPAAQAGNGQPEPERPEAAEGEPADRAERELGAPEPDAGAEQSLDERGPQPVVGSTDEGLADSYLLAVESYALAVDHGDVEQAKLWEALRRAAIEEARVRHEFGQAEPDASLSRRQRRQRDKRLRALIKARDESSANPPDA